MCADSINVVCPLFPEEGDGSRPISALQLSIWKISSKRAMRLNLEWHSRMPYIGSYQMCNPCFGAEFANRFYAIAMWSLPIAANRLTDGFNSLELRRMAICNDAPKNTASRMLKIMRLSIKREMPQIKKLISYQDTAVHLGTIYKADNWTPIDCGEFISWDKHSSRPGSVEQSTAKKVRWELFTMRRPRYYIVPQWYRTHDGQRPLSWAIYRETEFLAYSWSWTKAYIALQLIKRTCK